MPRRNGRENALMGYLDDVERSLLSRCPTLLYDWLPEGRQQGQYYCCANLAGGRGDSLKVNLRSGKWADWAQQGVKGTSGSNLVSLFAAVKSIEWKDALHQLGEQYGVPRPKMQKANDWTVVTPVPESAYVCDIEGRPLLPESSHTKSVAAYWCYFDADFRLLCLRLRWNKPDGSKEVKPLAWARNRVTGDEAWQLRDLPEPRPLYSLPSLSLGFNKALVVEGEKTADAAQRLLPDWTVTTWPGGGKAVRKSDWSPLRRHPEARIVLWPDNDAPGLSAMAEVGEMLERDHEVVRLDPAWPKTFDLADAEAMGWDTARTEAWLAGNSIPVTPAAPQARPEVDLSGKDYRRQMGDIYNGMREMQAEIYNYDCGVVHIRRNVHGLLEVSPMRGQEFRAWAAKRIAAFHYSSGGKAPCQVSEDLANAVIFNAADSVPALKRFADIPIFTEAGNLLETSGYNVESKVYLSIPTNYDPELPLEESWGLVDDLLADFPFESPSDKTAAVAFVLTAVVRDLIQGPTPLFRFEAPAPGTGKSLLCEVLCEIVTPFPQEYDLSDQPEEVRKLLTTALTTSPAVIRFDNVKKLDLPPLMRALTAHTWGDRILGENREIKVPVRSLFAATLNNPDLTPEIFRRTVRIRLDAKLPNPETRPATSFRHHPLVEYVRQNRGILVSAFVAIAKAGVGQTAANLPAMGSYEGWISALAPILEISSYTDFLGNREEDRESSSGYSNEGIEQLVTLWFEQYGNYPVKTSQLLEIAQSIPALPGYRTKDGKPDPRAFGYLLRSSRDRIVCGMTIRHSKKIGSSASWKLEGGIPVTERLPYSDSDQNSVF
jgi:putative DNA primase/helicase